MTDQVVERPNDTFNVRYYRWALADADRELTHGFPWVSRIRGGFALKFMEVAAALGPADQGRLMVALLKRVHGNALRLMGEMVTAEDEALTRAYLDTGRARQKERYWQLRVNEPGRVRVDRKRLLTQVKAALTPILGRRIEQMGPSQGCRWITAVGPWTLRTIVDVGGRTSQLSYLHTLGTDDAPQLYLDENISFLLWLGIGQTVWDCLLESDTDEAIDILAQLCAHFMGAVPGLVAGLSPDGQRGDSSGVPRTSG